MANIINFGSSQWVELVTRTTPNASFKCVLLKAMGEEDSFLLEFYRNYNIDMSSRSVRPVIRLSISLIGLHILDGLYKVGKNKGAYTRVEGLTLQRCATLLLLARDIPEECILSLRIVDAFFLKELLEHFISTVTSDESLEELLEFDEEYAASTIWW